MNTRLKADELFPERTRFMIAIQDQVISTNNYNKQILKELNTANIRRKCQENLKLLSI
jgi:hypothetical protein